MYLWQYSAPRRYYGKPAQAFVGTHAGFHYLSHEFGTLEELRPGIFARLRIESAPPDGSDIQPLRLGITASMNVVIQVAAHTALAQIVQEYAHIALT
jgi:hypothetical protein